ncbi:hypothetical protein GCM10027089_36680 [Nocardia thraciensis]
MKRAYKYRFYPNAAQAAELERTFGCVRKVCNLAPEARTRSWYRDGTRINDNPTSIAVDRWCPSSKVCLAVQESMPMRVRVWTCGCGATHARDVNAAKNIPAAGLAVSVCGDGVRPHRSTPGGRSSARRKPRP